MTKQLIILSLLLVLGFSPAARAAGGSALEVNVDRGVSMTLATPASSVFIANPEIADVQVMSPTSIMIFGKRTGETTFMATDSAGRTLAERTIRVSQDLSGLRSSLTSAFPGNKIKVEPVPNGIVLTGEAKDAATITDAYKLAQRYIAASGGDIINRVHVVGSNQIQIRVRFAEVARKIDNSLGFNWNNVGNLAGFAFGIATGSGIGTGSNIIGTRPNNTALGLSNDVIGISHNGGRFDVNAVIDALAQDGLITILAEPNLTAMSGETANFLAGGEFPIPIPQGSGSISIEFKPYGISLAFTPTLVGDNRINIHVRPEVSQLTSSGSIILQNITVPALSTRKAETTVEVASGQSFAIAGLLDNNQAQTVNKYPLLGDMPILGSLFRSNRFQNNQSELVIIITPYIVRPSGEQLALPTDGFSPPSEMDRLWDQRKSSSDPHNRTMSGQPVGIKIEAPQASVMPQDMQEPSIPVAAPMAPVTKSPAIINPPPATAAPTPVGSGGFMLE